MQQEMFEEVIHEMPAGKLCGIYLKKMSYTEKEYPKLDEVRVSSKSS